MHSSRRTLLTAKVCSPHCILSSQPLLAASIGSHWPRPPQPASASLRRAKVYRPALALLTPLSMCYVRTRTRTSELAMYCLDCSDFAIIPPAPPFPSSPTTIATKVLRPPRRRRSPSPPFPSPQLPVAAKNRRPPRRSRSLSPQSSAALPVTVAAAPRRHQGPPPSLSSPFRVPIAVLRAVLPKMTS